MGQKKKKPEVRMDHATVSEGVDQLHICHHG